MMRRLAPVLLCGLLVLTGCSSTKTTLSTPDKTASSGAVPLGPSAAPGVCPAADARIVKGNGGVKVTGKAGAKPTITLPTQTAFDCRFYVEDLIVGDGQEVEAGATVTAHYVGVSWIHRKEFDASWGGDPATFPLDQVVKGWTIGIPNMKVGGRRLLVIPPFLGYGPDTRDPSAIAVNDTLVFVIDLTATA